MPADSPTFTMMDDAMIAILRQKTEAERLAITFDMWEFARDMIRASVLAEHPDWTPEQVQRVVAKTQRIETV